MCAENECKRESFRRAAVLWAEKVVLGGRCELGGEIGATGVQVTVSGLTTRRSRRVTTAGGHTIPVS